MDLREFIKESLVQISQGISEANDALQNTEAVVNPNGIQAFSTGAQAYGRIQNNPDNGKLVHLVSFDVALHAASGAEAGGGIKLSIASISVGGEGKTTDSSSTESRIKFAIPVIYPVGKQT